MAKAPSEPEIKTPLDVQMRKRELQTVFNEIDDNGFAALPMTRLIRLLGRGNKSARAWRELLDAWEEMDGDREELHVYITPWQGQVVLTKGASKAANELAGE